MSGKKWYRCTFTDYPFLYIDNNHHIIHGSDMCVFSEHKYREISFEEILFIKIEPTYRPFKSKEECWQEMLKHNPFGWIKHKESNMTSLIGNVSKGKEVLIWTTYEEKAYSASHLFNDYVFTDGTPFGVKEE